MASHHLLWAQIFALATSAWGEILLPASGTLRPGPGDSSEALRAFESAGQRPNWTDSVTFSRVSNNTPETWTWRINITDLTIPNDISELGSSSASYSKGFHVANTQWQLQWPSSSGNSSEPSSSDNLLSFLSERNLDIALNALSVFVPSNVTNQYNANDNGNCTSLLGSECTQAITREIGKGGAIQVAFPECQNTIGINGFTQPGGAVGRMSRSHFLCDLKLTCS
jgi:hypothetical protein